MSYKNTSLQKLLMYNIYIYTHTYTEREKEKRESKWSYSKQ